MKMTQNDLNRDIKRLWVAYIPTRSINTEIWEQLDWDLYYEKQERFKVEFLRLYNADIHMKYMNANSIKILLVMNRQQRIVPIAAFGIQIII